MLAWTIYISFIGVLVLMLLPRDNARAARIVALLTAIAGCAVAFVGAIQQANPGEVTTIVKADWIPSIGAKYFLGADGISLVLVVLTGLAAIAGILFSWNIEKRTKEFFAFYLALIGAVYGVFLSFDVLLLFMFYELTIIPKYFLIARWGSTRKEYGAIKLAIYSFVGSHLVLIGLIAAWVVARSQLGHASLDLIELSQVSFPIAFQHWVFPLVFVGFAILAGMWPFHTWAPTGHVAAPTAGSMLLAGVVMKLGAYGCLRVAMLMFPEGVRMWQDEIAGLAVVGIVYGAGVALVQKDFKFVIGYSSVSHMGFVLLGLATLNTIGLDGAVLQMFSHGIIAGLLFAVVGRMVYDRTHTRFQRSRNDAARQTVAVRRRDVRDRRHRLNGIARLQRLHRGTASADGCVGGVPETDHSFRCRHSRWRGLHVARGAKGILFRRPAKACRPRSSNGTDFHAGTLRRGDAHRRVAGHRPFPRSSDELD